MQQHPLAHIGISHPSNAPQGRSCLPDEISCIAAKFPCRHLLPPFIPFKTPRCDCQPTSWTATIHVPPSTPCIKIVAIVLHVRVDEHARAHARWYSRSNASDKSNVASSDDLLMHDLPSSDRSKGIDSTATLFCEEGDGPHRPALGAPTQSRGILKVRVLCPCSSNLSVKSHPT